MSLWFDLIATARPELCAIARRYGFLTGSRVDKIGEYDDRDSVEFIDMDWHNPTPDRLRRECRIYEPKYAVAGDYDADAGNIERVNSRARELAKCVDSVIVVPKRRGEIDRVPDFAVVGYSVPTDYGGTTASLAAYKGRDVHVLGGTPHRQRQIVDCLGRDVVSVDGNSILKGATTGMTYYTKSKPRWKYTAMYPNRSTSLCYEWSCLHVSYYFREAFEGDIDRQNMLAEFE